MRRLERHAFHYAAGQFNRRGVAIVAWVKTNNLIARTHQGGYRRIQRFGRPCGYRDLAVRIRFIAIQLSRFIRNGFTQRLHAGHRRVLVCPLRHVVRQTLLQIFRPVKIRKTL